MQGVVVAISTTKDGSMRATGAPNPQEVYDNRRRFFEQLSLTPDQAILVPVTYDEESFVRYYDVGTENQGEGMAPGHPPAHAADALLTRDAGVVLFLPLGDCIGAVLYDAKTHSLMVSHLGRHNLEQFGGTKCVEYFIEKTGSDPRDIEVWLSPAAGSTTYPLYSFENRSLHDVASEQLQAGGIVPENITGDLSDTVSHPDYFSHSAHLADNSQPNGRHALVAVMR